MTSRHVLCAHPHHTGPDAPLAVWEGDDTQTPPALICQPCITSHGHPGHVAARHRDAGGARPHPPLQQRPGSH